MARRTNDEILDASKTKFERIELGKAPSGRE